MLSVLFLFPFTAFLFIASTILGTALIVALVEDTVSSGVDTEDMEVVGVETQ